MRHAFCFLLLSSTASPLFAQAPSPFNRDNLVAWCIVPFDAKKRGPEDRAALLQELGFKRFAYDWRAEHVPTFDAEITALEKRGIRLQAFWFPADLGKDARAILAVLERRKVKTELWVTMGDPGGKDQAAKVEAAAKRLRPIAEEAARIGCKVGLYNHGGWFGEPENQLAILDMLKLPNVGIVYNQHHGHEHLDRFPAMLKKMLPHLYALNLNGMIKDGDKVGEKIVPLGQGELDLELLKTIQASGYRGPIGILGHTMDDAADRLRDNLDGLDWLVPQLDGKAPGPRPQPRTYKTPPPKTAGAATPYRPERVAELVKALKNGDARRGAAVFRSPQFACMNCHKVGGVGGAIGPDLTKVGTCITPDLIVEAVLWPKRQVKDEFKAFSVVTAAGKLVQGYKERENGREVVLRDPATGTVQRFARGDIEELREIGTLMPDGLAEAMSPQQLHDLLRFLTELGKTDGLVELVHDHQPASFPLIRAPLDPKAHPNWQHPVNRDRVFDYYARQAEYFSKQPKRPRLLPDFPGLDGPEHGHWGNQNDTVWKDDRWNQSDLGTLQCGIFRAGNLVVPRGVCVRLGDKGELAACFNPETLCYEAVWEGGFVKFSDVRHGFMHGLLVDGKLLPRLEGKRPEKSFVYRGFYRHGPRVVFAYEIDGVLMLDAPWVENGKFTKVVASADKHPLAHLTRGGPMQWPQVLPATCKVGDGGPYAVDTIGLPFDNPWKALVFCGDHDFLPDGSAVVCTMQGDVWRADGIDYKLDHVRWRRIASGLHQALGLVVSEGQIYVLGRDQITRLVDLNGDGEIDYYECFSNAYGCSTGGHDFICGLQRDSAGRFYAAASKQGLLRISSDGKSVETLATGFRNPDGLALATDGAITVPCSEGDWTPASMLCLVRPGYRYAGTTPLIGGHQPPYFGYGGPRDGRAPDLPFVYLPRGVDNSSGGQVLVDSDRWGPLKGQMVHLSFGAAMQFLLLRDEVDGQAQGGVVPFAGDFDAGCHRGRFNSKDGQLYVSGMNGWGSYGPADGCFQRVRWTGQPAHLPTAFHTHENGVLVRFSEPIDRGVAERIENQFAQAWNYRYSSGYGSSEFSPSHRDVRGHDVLTITRAHVLPDGRSLFLEMPDLQPVNQLHLRLRAYPESAHDLFLTVHRLDTPFTSLPDYRPNPRIIAAHPMLIDLQTLAKAKPNPWRDPIPKARTIELHADKNLTYVERSFTVKAGEAIKLVLTNPDEVPHNWALLQPGALKSVGEQVNRLISDPAAAARHYVPESKEVLVYTDMVPPNGSARIWFRAPTEKGRYPYLCTFPGHWMVMNGQMIVE
jgi:putative heme-binding domain-containing protein